MYRVITLSEIPFEINEEFEVFCCLECGEDAKLSDGCGIQEDRRGFICPMCITELVASAKNYRVVTLNSRNQVMRTWIETDDESVAIKVFNSVTSLKPELNIKFQTL